jgi:hypothetical protein
MSQVMGNTNLLWLVRWRDMEPSAEEHVVDVMHNIQSILIRANICPMDLAEQTSPVLFHHWEAYKLPPCMRDTVCRSRTRTPRQR